MTAPVCAIHNTSNEIDDGAFFCVECDADGLTEVTITVCGPCLMGQGGECHTPGCAFWMCPAVNQEQAVVIRRAAELDDEPSAGSATAETDS